uniref:Uncharacterized protein n=1 Tax=viral metagenome TaxID=1070528 RepID=A0A6C0J9Y8_9ZZZZ
MKKYIIILVVFIGTIILISCRKNMEGMENESSLQKESEDNLFCNQNSNDCLSEKTKKRCVIVNQGEQPTCKAISQLDDIGTERAQNDGNFMCVGDDKKFGRMTNESCAHIGGTVKGKGLTPEQQYHKMTGHSNNKKPKKHQDDPWAFDDNSTESIFDDPAVTGVEVNDNGKWIEKKSNHPHHTPSRKGGEKIPTNLDYCPSGKYTWGNQKANCKKIPTIPEGCGVADTQFCALVNNQNVNDNPDESGVSPSAYKSVDVKDLCNTNGSCDTITGTVGCGKDTDNIKADSISNTITSCVKNWFSNSPAVGQKGARDPIHLVDGTIISPIGSK